MLHFGLKRHSIATMSRRRATFRWTTCRLKMCVVKYNNRLTALTARPVDPTKVCPIGPFVITLKPVREIQTV